jgi:hemerythrin
MVSVGVCCFCVSCCDLSLIMLSRFVHYKTDIPFIDAEHHELMIRMNEIIHELKYNHRIESATEKIDELSLAIKRHFATEEGFMKSVNFPMLNDHVNEHTQLIKQLDNKLNKLNTVFDLINFVEFLEKIIVTHIDNYDLQYAKYYKEI